MRTTRYERLERALDILGSDWDFWHLTAPLHDGHPRRKIFCALGDIPDRRRLIELAREIYRQSLTNDEASALIRRRVQSTATMAQATQTEFRFGPAAGSRRPANPPASKPKAPRRRRVRNAQTEAARARRRADEDLARVFAIREAERAANHCRVGSGEESEISPPWDEPDAQQKRSAADCA